MSFSVLFVCTGNICRSPLAERLFLLRLPSDVPIVASSAGTFGLTGRPIDEPTAALLREYGGDPSGHAARRLTPDMLSVDLVLSAGTEHRSAIVQAEPRSFRKVFTLREFARLGGSFGALDAIDEDALRGRVAAIAAERGLASAPAPGADEIADPFGADAVQTRASAESVSIAVDGVIAALGL